ncbi:MAG: hypothetical protein KAQ94_07120 [Arcobacteraceae bacterium]|nr:hypothetical protein [Arcobacteraceae bacterium]
MYISTHGVAFASYDVKATNKTTQEISDKKVSFDDTVKETNTVENIVYHTTTKSENSTPTIFTDPVTKKFAIVSLEKETLDKLKSQFGEDNIIKNNDSTLRLTNKAEAFVSGWFADIAYKRDFLYADKNSDGILTEEEYDKTYNDFGIEGMALTENTTGKEKLLIAGEKIIENNTYALSEKAYLKEIGYYRNYREFDIATSLDDELNTTLQVDKNFDGQMTLEEAYSTKADKNYKNVVLRHLEEFGITTIPSELDTSSFDHVLRFILDIFMQKDKAEQDKIMLNLMNKLDINPDFDAKELEQIYTHENLEHIVDLKEYNKKQTTVNIHI